MTINLTREEAQQVLDAMTKISQKTCKVMSGKEFDRLCDAVETLRARLAQPEPEPVAWMVVDSATGKIEHVSRTRECSESWLQYVATRKLVPLYTAPPQREWQGLETDGESQEIWLKVMEETKDKRHLPVLEFAVAIEAKLKEKNGG